MNSPQEREGNWPSNEKRRLRLEWPVVTSATETWEGLPKLSRQCARDLIDQELTVPDTLTKAAWGFNNETRKAQYFILPESAADAPPEPSESEIKTYYDNNKRTFTAPEQRTLSLLRLQPADVAETVSVSEEDLKAAYDRRIDTYTVPEKRTVQQIAFLNKEEAEAARKRILEGADFVEIAKEKGLTEKDYSLGTVTQREIADPAPATRHRT